MATIKGTGGNFSSVTDFNAKYDAWSMNYNPTVVEDSGFSDAGNRTFAVTAISGTITATGTGITGSAPALATAFASATPDFSGASGSATLTALSGDTIAGTVVVTGVALHRRFDGKLEWTMTGIFSGAITQSWS